MPPDSLSISKTRGIATNPSDVLLGEVLPFATVDIFSKMNPRTSGFIWCSGEVGGRSSICRM